MEFLEHKQRNMTVAEYAAKFEEPVASCSETSHILNFLHLSLDNG